MHDDYSRALRALQTESRLRAIPPSMPEGMIDFTGNDYLGIAARGELQSSFLEHLAEQAGTPTLTSAASRLLAVKQEEYSELEQYLALAYGSPALLFNSGYHANTGCVSALSDADTLIVADKLSHASIIDGLRLGGSRFKRFPHNDLNSLRRVLEREAKEYSRIWVIVESIYSMDGDSAPLSELVEMKREFPQMRLYVDEAHGLGVRGTTGLGLCEELGVLSDVDLLIGTFGKACASIGAFAICSEELRSYLLNTARSFIFSTALPPLNVAYTLHVLKAMRSMNEERMKLRNLSQRLKEGLERVTGKCCPSTSQIIPWITGDSALAVEYASRLRKLGFMAMPIRRPTVAAGTERIRFSLSAAHEPAHIDSLINAIATTYEN